MPCSRLGKLVYPAFIAVLLLSACATGSQSGLAPAQSQVPPGISKALPFPADHAASEALTFTVLGNAEDSRSAGAVEQGTSMQLTSSGGMEFAIYRFSTPSALVDVSISLADAQTTDAYIAVANYSELRWDISGPFSTSSVASLSSADNVSPLGGIYVAVVVGAGGEARIDFLQLNADNSPPTAVLTKSPDGDAPLLVDFDASTSSDIDGTIVKYEWDWTDNGSFDLDSGTDPTVQHLYNNPGTRTARVRVTDDGGASSSDTVVVISTVPASFAPVASFTASADGPAPLMVSFDASLSGDADGTIVDYAWDFDSDGSFDENGAADNTAHSYTDPGVYTCTLRVTDNDALTDEATAAITAQGWVVVTVDATPGAGYQTHINIVNGHPAIAYYANPGLKYARSTTESGADPADWADQQFLIDSVGDTGQRPWLANINGRPAISYYYFDGGDLKYVRAATIDGADQGDWTPITILGTDNAGYVSSLRKIQGNPAIAYYNLTTQHLHYIRATTADGEDPLDWTQMSVIDSANSAGEYVSLNVVEGNPAVSYYYASGPSDLRYARCSTSTGAGVNDWAGTVVTVDSAGNVGRYSSLAVVNGNPAIAYLDDSNTHLKYARSTTTTGAAAGDWTQIVTVDPNNNTGAFSSLAVVNDLPCIAYRAGDIFVDTDMYLAQSANADGFPAPNWSFGAGDSTGKVGAELSLVDNHGHPCVAYHDDTNNSLKYAIMY